MIGMVWLVAAVYSLFETAYFGWNVFPKSPEEMICDGIAMVIIAIAFASWKPKTKDMKNSPDVTSKRAGGYQPTISVEAGPPAAGSPADSLFERRCGCMREIIVTYKTCVPPGMTYEQIMSWLRYALDERGPALDDNNPMEGCGPGPNGGSIRFV